MSKRTSKYARERDDYYPTPIEAVHALIPHLPKEPFLFSEPCAGDGRLVDHIQTLTEGQPYQLFDVNPRRFDICTGDARDVEIGGDLAITNPPWSRDVLHPIIRNLSDQVPTWLLFDADWIHTRQSAEYLPRLKAIVSIGRVKWIAGSKSVGFENCAWHLFDKPAEPRITTFWGRYK